MIIKAECTKQRVIIDLKATAEQNNSKKFILERKAYTDKEWSRLCASNPMDGVIGDGDAPAEGSQFIPLSKLNDTGINKTVFCLGECTFVDDSASEGLYQYRSAPLSEFIDDRDTIADNCYGYTPFVRTGDAGAVGYSFGNYHAPQGQWGQIVTADDLRYTYLWGTDFKAANGAFFDDAQIEYLIDAATAKIGRQLDIDIVKTTHKTVFQQGDGALKRNPGGEATKQADGTFLQTESAYDYDDRQVARFKTIKTRHRPLLQIDALRLVSGNGNVIQDYKNDCRPDWDKGLIKITRPYYLGTNYQTSRNIATAVFSRGTNIGQERLFYQLDYASGYENSDAVPLDLRETIAKLAATDLLGIVGDGLMSGFSSSSLSMDGVSESFSSTQSATSAYFGARIKVYQDDIANYIKENRRRFSSLAIGCL